MDQTHALLRISEIIVDTYRRAQQISEEEEWSKSIEGFHDFDYYTRQYQVLAADALRQYEDIRQILIATFGGEPPNKAEIDTQI